MFKRPSSEITTSSDTADVALQPIRRRNGNAVVIGGGAIIVASALTVAFAAANGAPETQPAETVASGQNSYTPRQMAGLEWEIENTFGNEPLTLISATIANNGSAAGARHGVIDLTINGDTEDLSAVHAAGEPQYDITQLMASDGDQPCDTVAAWKGTGHAILEPGTAIFDTPTPVTRDYTLTEGAGSMLPGSNVIMAVYSVGSVAVTGSHGEITNVSFTARTADQPAYQLIGPSPASSVPAVELTQWL